MHITDPVTGDSYFRKLRRAGIAEKVPHALTFSCYRRFPLLARDRSRLWFVEALKAARERWPVDLWAWVIMPEHVHVILAPRESSVRVGSVKGWIKEQVARKAIGWLESNAPDWIPKITVREGGRFRRRFWQPGGGYDRVVDQTGTLVAMIEYIHLNPVRRGLVERPEQWEWSSARWYAGEGPVHIEMDATIPSS